MNKTEQSAGAPVANPLARLLIWRGPAHCQVPPLTARTYDEFPEDAARPADSSAYWENGAKLYARTDETALAAERERWAQERIVLRSLLRQARLVLRGPHTQKNIVVRELIERIELRGVHLGD